MVKDYNEVPELAERKKTVLHFIAQNGEANIYKISRACKITYSTAHSSVKTLEKEGLIRLESQIKNEKMVLTTVYTLTAKGVHRSIFDLPTWAEKIAVVNKWQKLLQPNVLEWMTFVGDLDDKKTEAMVNSQIGSFLNLKSTRSPMFYTSSNLGIDTGFVDVVDEGFFEATIGTMLISPQSGERIISKIDSYPRVKKQLLTLLDEDIASQEDYLEKTKIIRTRFEQSST